MQISNDDTKYLLAGIEKKIPAIAHIDIYDFDCLPKSIFQALVQIDQDDRLSRRNRQALLFQELFAREKQLLIVKNIYISFVNMIIDYHKAI